MSVASPIKRIIEVHVLNQSDPAHKGPFLVVVPEGQEGVEDRHARRARRAVRLVTQMPGFEFEPDQDRRVFKVDVSDEPETTEEYDARDDA